MWRCCLQRLSWYRGLLLTLLFAVVAAWTQWPTLRPSALHTTLPTGSTRSPTVPLFNAWTIWWNADRAAHGFHDYWNAPIFFPERGALAFSEPQPATLLAAPVWWSTGSLVLAYKYYLLLSLILNGLLTIRLLRRLHVCGWPAVCGGLLVLLLPLVHLQNDVLQMIPLWGILWTWEAVLAIGRRPTLLRGVQAGLAFGTTCLLSLHHGLFLAILLCGTVTSAVAWGHWRRRPLWVSGVAAVCLAALITGPLVLPMHAILQRYAFQRSEQLVTDLSAELADYGRVPVHAWIGPGQTSRPATAALLPGWIKLGLALVGATAGLSRRRTRRATGFLLLTGGLAVLLSLGRHLQLGSWQPWPVLAAVVPGLAQVRNVFRFAYFAQLSTVLLATVGLSRLLQWAWVRCGRRPRQQWLTAGCWVLGGLAVCEVPPAPLRLAPVPELTAAQNWIRCVRTELRPGHGVLCLPCSPGVTVRDFEATTRWMYLATQHGQPLVNGYSGFFPPRFFRLQAAVNAQVWQRPQASAESLSHLLTAAQVDLVVIDTRQLAPAQVTAALGPELYLQPLLRDSSGVHVYRLRPVRSPSDVFAPPP